MSFHNEVLTYIPESCTRVDPSDANVDDSQDFKPGEASYWTGKIGSMIPGLVLGGICLVGFVLMLLWICVRCCRRRRLNSKPGAQKPGKEEGTQFLTSPADGGSVASAPPAFYQAPPGRRRRRWANVLAASLLLLSLASVGTGAWAMGESIMQTDTVISNFWDLVDQVEATINTAQQDLGTLSYSINLLQPAASKLRNAAPGLALAVANALNVTEAQAQQILDTVAGLPQDSMTEASTTINTTALPLLRDQILEVVHDVQDFESPTMTLQDKWRFVVFAVLFGLLILSVMVTTALCFWMRFGRWASALVAVTWFFNALVMLGGVGLMNGVVVISADACLYTETYIYHVVGTKISEPARSLVLGGMDYYFGVRNLTGIVNDTLTAKVDGYDPELAEAIFNQLTGSNITEVLVRAQQVNQTAEAFGGLDALNAQLARLRFFGVDAATIQVLQDGLTGLSGILWSTVGLVDGLRRASVEPIYHGFKGYLCCDVSTSGHWLYVSWTVAGSITLAFCVAATIRVVWQTFAPEDKGWVSAFDKVQPPPESELAPVGLGPEWVSGGVASTGPSKDSVGASGDLSDTFLDDKRDSSMPEAHPDGDVIGAAHDGSGGPLGVPPVLPQQPTPPAGAYPPIF
ncbi:hypothetical protein N2152v2_000453 [Parachlorella kessleri]